MRVVDWYLLAAGIIGYKALVEKVFDNPPETDFIPVEKLATGSVTITDLDFLNNDKLRASAKFLVELKAKYPNNLSQKIYGIRVCHEGFNCAALNIDGKNVVTDRHGIQISKNLITNITKAELQAIFGHEVGHIALNHCTNKNTALRISYELATFLSIGLTSYMLSNLLLGYSNNSDLTQVLVLSISLVLFHAYIVPIGREQEFAADKKAAVYTRDKNLGSSLKKFNELVAAHGENQLNKYLPVEEESNTRIDSRFFLHVPKQRSMSEDFTKFAVHSFKAAYPYFLTFRQVFDEHPPIAERVERIEKLEIF